jgi:protein-tyrosine phosphatase
MLDFDAIDDRIIVGSAFSAGDVPLLAELNVGAILNLRDEAHDPVEALAEVGIDYAQVRCKDFHAPTLVQMDEAVAAISRFVDDGKRVYVHCYAGLQRSVTIAACFFIASDPEKWNARSALDEVIGKRRRACPLREQIDALLEFDRYVRARTQTG